MVTKEQNQDWPYTRVKVCLCHKRRNALSKCHTYPALLHIAGIDGRHWRYLDLRRILGQRNLDWDWHAKMKKNCRHNLKLGSLKSNIVFLLHDTYIHKLMPFSHGVGRNYRTPVAILYINPLTSSTVIRLIIHAPRLRVLRTSATCCVSISHKWWNICLAFNHYITLRNVPIN